MPKQQDFRFRYQPEDGTEDAYLVEYLKTVPLGERREMILEALRAFWLPIALKEAQINSQFLKTVGLRELRNLGYQLDLLREELSLNAPSLIIVQKGNEGQSRFDEFYGDKKSERALPEEGLSGGQRGQMLQNFVKKKQ
ncbi:hypothetical protein NG798_26750 [Ancylothrix sp. C2]|uniref:hypothetical protein n=1 Tax=Ancylothrix sp. D3o TaxID=2953691 RepID=UPI0021BB9272|nr:hypothetical protein [Ancylothrix sp. D3o]MCT7953404.1 hypothetical protein [Ancylothrix sp. D3o]